LPDWIGVGTALHKFRPDDALPAVNLAALSAARNEFEAFQVVVHGGPSGRTVAGLTLSELVGPEGAVIPSSQAVVYRVALYNVPSPSNGEGAAGPWPDPLIPAVDPYFGETRNAFPLVVPAGEVRSVWVDLYVPTDAAAGSYSGIATVETSEGDFEIAIDLQVYSFLLPSTSTLPSAFGIGWNAGCVAHHGSYVECGADPGVEHYLTLYAREALDHRVSLESVVYYFDPASSSYGAEHFAELYGPLLDGSDPGPRLAGARLTTLRANSGAEATLTAWRDLFDDRGWSAATTLFHYTCDEPAAGCAWSDIEPRSSAPRAAGVPTLVTTDLERATSNGVLDSIAILTPVINYLLPREGTSTRDDYDEWLSGDPGRRLWWYQSCMSHGCGSGCDTTPGDWYTGWPSYVIDASAIQARAMEWLSFLHDIQGELYFSATHQLSTAWDDQCDFSGSGDGTLFYPGLPSRIGGTTDIPLPSIRLKLIREGMEDYEYLVILEQAAGRAEAEAFVRELFADAWSTTATTPEQLYGARARIAERIEELLH
jgi:hypothetical protein